MNICKYKSIYKCYRTHNATKYTTINITSLIDYKYNKPNYTILYTYVFNKYIEYMVKNQIK